MTEETYIIYSTRKEEGEVRFYFWTGNSFVGDQAQAKVYPSYGDVAGAIWNGSLWDATEQIKKLGFRWLRYYPSQGTDIKPEWCGDGVIPIGEKHE